MGLLQAIVLEALSGYFPGLDSDSLRVNILKGRVDLKDVVLTPGPVLAIAGFPFRLTRGTVGSLGFHVPWASIYSAPVKVNAHQVELHFAEVPFPESQQEVFEAYRDEKRRAKNRTLAEGERAESAITRALQTIFPMLLDRVEADISDVKLFLHFVSGENATFTFKEFKVSSSEGSKPGPKNRGDLEKTIIWQGISVTLSDGEKTKLAAGPTQFDLGLRLRHGVYGIDLSLPGEMAIVVDMSLEAFVHNLKHRISRWKNAAKYQRPHQSASEDSKGWLRYAIRASCGRKGINCSKLSVDDFRNAVTSFLEYKRLHVLRLRKGDNLSERDEDRIRVLEDALDADMILLLRRNARAEVMADEVSAFATKEWLSWVFFDRRMSEEREHLAGEIRKSLSVVERREREEHDAGRIPSALNEPIMTRSWSSARVSFVLNCLCLRFTDSDSEIGSAKFSSACCRAELDSGLEAFGIVFTVSTFAFCEESRCIFSSGLGEAEDTVTEIEAVPYCFEAKVQKPALADKVSVSILLAPYSGVVDVTRLPTYFAIFKTMKICATSNGSGVTRSSESTTVNSFSRQVNLDIRVSTIELSVGYGERSPQAEKDHEWFLFTLNPSHVLVSDFLINPEVRGSISGTIGSSTAPGVDGDMMTRHQISNAGGICLVDTANALSLSVDASFALHETRTCTELRHVEAVVTSAGVVGLLRIVKVVRKHLEEKHLQMTDSESFPAPTNNTTGKVALSRTHRLELSELLCRVQETVSDGNLSISITLNASELLFVASEGSSRRLTIKDVSIIDEVCGGYIKISASTRQAFGLHMEWIDTETGRITETETMMGSTAVLLKPESVFGFATVLLRHSEAVRIGLQGDTSVAETEFPATVSTPLTDLQSRISILIHNMELRCVSEGTDVFLCCEHLYFVGQGAVLSGSLDGLRCRDASNLSGIHSIPVKTLPQLGPSQPDRRAVTFSLAPNAATIHLHSLQITVLRSFMERFTGMCHALSLCIDRAVMLDSVTHIEGSPGSMKDLGTSKHRSISIQGSDITLRVPVSPHKPDCVCLEASRLTSTIGADTFVLSLRKASFLTRTTSSEEVLISPTSAGEPCTTAEYAVMLRGLDLDISNSFSSVTMNSELAEQRRNEWNVQVLSRAAFFITAGQVRLLRLIPASLQSTVRSDESCDEGQATYGKSGASPNAKRKASVAVLTSFEHFALKLETQAISAELLHDDDRGAVVSTIASLEFDPLHYSLRRACEAQGNELETIVTRWSLTSNLVHVEDRGFQVPAHRREVVTHRQDHTMMGNPGSSDELPKRSPVLAVQAVSRTDRTGSTKSSVEIRIRDMRIVPSPSLYDRLTVFFTYSSLSSQPGNRTDNSDPSYGSQSEIRRFRHSSGAPASSASLPLKARVRGRCDQIPSKKVTIKASDVVIQVFGRGRRASESYALLTAGFVKVTLLHAGNGKLLTGSQIRARDIAVSMVWLPAAVVKTEPTVIDVVDDIAFLRANRNIATRAERGSRQNRETFNLQEGQSSCFLRHSLTVPTERFRWNFFRQDNDTQQVEEVMHVPSVALRLPTENADRVVLLVPKIFVDARIPSLFSFAHLISVLDCLPKIEADSPIRFPPIQFSVNNAFMRAEPATRQDPEELGEIRDAIVRLRCAFDGVVQRNLSGLSIRLELTIDASDEKGGLRDRILSPCEVELECKFAQNTSILVRSERLLRIALSPLTARAVAALALSVPRKPQKSRNRGRIVTSKREQNRLTTVNRTLQPGVMKFSVALRGISLVCTAEQPRVQLLRLSLRQITLKGFISLSDQGGAGVDIEVQDVVLEDIFSWRLFGDTEGNEDSVRWSEILVGKRHDTTRWLTSSMYSNQDKAVAAKVVPVLSCRASWGAPLEHVSVHIESRGFELNLNMALLPTLVAWLHSVTEAVKRVQVAVTSTGEDDSARLNDQGTGSNVRIGIDHVVVDPFVVIISTKAPPPRLQESFSRRALAWLLGSESVTGIVIQVPQVVFNGDFLSSDRFVERVRSVYANALTSPQMGYQIVLQMPSVSRLARVMWMSFLRQRHMDWLGSASATTGRDMMSPRQLTSGLLMATLPPQSSGLVHLQTIRPVHSATHSKDLEPQADENVLISGTSLHSSTGLIEVIKL